MNPCHRADCRILLGTSELKFCIYVGGGSQVLSYTYWPAHVPGIAPSSSYEWTHLTTLGGWSIIIPFIEERLRHIAIAPLVWSHRLYMAKLRFELRPSVPTAGDFYICLFCSACRIPRPASQLQGGGKLEFCLYMCSFTQTQKYVQKMMGEHDSDQHHLPSSKRWGFLSPCQCPCSPVVLIGSLERRKVSVSLTVFTHGASLWK